MVYIYALYIYTLYMPHYIYIYIYTLQICVYIYYDAIQVYTVQINKGFSPTTPIPVSQMKCRQRSDEADSHDRSGNVLVWSYSLNGYILKLTVVFCNRYFETKQLYCETEQLYFETKQLYFATGILKLHACILQLTSCISKLDFFSETCFLKLPKFEVHQITSPVCAWRILSFYLSQDFGSRPMVTREQRPHLECGIT